MRNYKIGLDMYLTAKKYLSLEDDKRRKKIMNIFKEIKDYEVEEVAFKVAYWRKAQAIHNWFVKNIQDGEDDCRKYYVVFEQLEELLKIVNEILGVEEDDKNKIVNALSGKEFDLEKAKELLPDEEEYDEWYLENLKYTKEVLDKLIKEKDKFKGFDFDYSSSW